MNYILRTATEVAKSRAELVRGAAVTGGYDNTRLRGTLELVLIEFAMRLGLDSYPQDER